MKMEETLKNMTDRLVMELEDLRSSLTIALTLREALRSKEARSYLLFFHGIYRATQAHALSCCTKLYDSSNDSISLSRLARFAEQNPRTFAFNEQVRQDPEAYSVDIRTEARADCDRIESCPLVQKLRQKRDKEIAHMDHKQIKPDSEWFVRLTSEEMEKLYTDAFELVNKYAGYRDNTSTVRCDILIRQETISVIREVHSQNQDLV